MSGDCKYTAGLQLQNNASQGGQRVVKHATVTFNNQSTVLLEKIIDGPQFLDRTETQITCLLHDNRVYAFQRRKPENNSKANTPISANVNPPTSDTNPPIADANPSTADANPPIADANPSIADADPSTADANSPTADANSPNAYANAPNRQHSPSDPTADVNAPPPASIETSTSSPEQNLIQNIFTTPKYRILNGVFLLFRILDNATLLVIIAYAISEGFDVNSADCFMKKVLAMSGLLAVAAVEYFYDILMLTHVWWTLQRLSFLIGLLFFIPYGFIGSSVISKLQNYNDSAVEGMVCTTESQNVPSDPNLRTFCTMLVARLVIFALEEVVDVFIDMELHNDLCKIWNEDDGVEDHAGCSCFCCFCFCRCTKPQQPQQGNRTVVGRNQSTQLADRRRVPEASQETGSFCSLSKLRSYYCDVTQSTKVTKLADVTYRGSFFAWWCYSVYTPDVWHRKPYACSFGCTGIVYCLLATITWALPLLAMVSFAYLLILYFNDFKDFGWCLIYLGIGIGAIFVVLCVVYGLFKMCAKCKCNCACGTCCPRKYRLCCCQGNSNCDGGPFCNYCKELSQL